MGLLKRLFGRRGMEPSRGAGEKLGDSMSKEAGDDGGSARITVGTCPECGGGLKTRKRAVRPAMNLTCRCGWSGRVDTEKGTIVVNDAPDSATGEASTGPETGHPSVDAESASEPEGVSRSLGELVDSAAKAGFLAIDKSKILDVDLTEVNHRVDDLISRIDADGLRSVHISIAGYESDSRALFAIPEVRTWCEKLTGHSRVVPLLDEETLSWYVPAVAPIDIVDADKTTTKFHWSAEACVRQFCVVGFLAAYRVTSDKVILRELLEQFTVRLQTVATQFGTDLVLDRELAAQIQAAAGR